MTQQPKDWQAMRAQMRADALAFVETTPSADEAGATILEVIRELANEAPEAARRRFLSSPGYRFNRGASPRSPIDRVGKCS